MHSSRNTMICRLSTKITDKLLTRNAIDLSEYDLYLYGFFVIFTNLFLVLFCLLWGLLFRIVIQALLFFITFLLFHKFAGGFHATTENHCQIITLSSFLCCLIGIKLSIHRSISIFDLIMLFGVLLILILFSPADTPQKPLNKDEKMKFKKKVVVLSFVVFISLIISFYYSKSIALVFYPIFFATSLESVSVIAGKLLNGKELF